MAHYPLNHHLRQTYRFLAALAALYLAVAGLVALVATWGDPFFEAHGEWALGLRFNPAGAWLDSVVGVVLLGAILLGGNVHHLVTMVLGWALCGLGLLTMAFLQTDANVLHASMSNIIVTILVGLVLLTAGLYGKVGTADAARVEQSAAHGSH